MKKLQERKVQLQAKYNFLKVDVFKAISNGADSGSSASVLLEFNAMTKEIQALNQQIFNIEHADEIKAELKAKEAAKAKIVSQTSKLQGNFQKWDSKIRIIDSADKVIDILKVQRTPLSICVEPNDAFIKSVFKASKAAYRALLGSKFYNVKEKRKPKKNPSIFSKLKIQNADGYDDDFPLDEYARADGNENFLRATNLLLGDIIDAKINRQEMEGVIFFKANSPLFQIANAKNQVIRYPHALLNTRRF